MANIQNVDYKNIPAIAKQIRVHGQELNSEVIAAYNSVNDMRNAWYGHRYNELITGFNNLNTSLNQILEVVVTKLPFELETVANNYAVADTGDKVTSAESTSISRINEIGASTEGGLRFLTNDVMATQTNVVKCFNNSVDLMNRIESDFGQLNWDSESASNYKNLFNTLKTSIIQAFDAIKSDFDKLMTGALEEMQKAETANNVS